MNRIRIAALLLPLAAILTPARADAQWIYPGYPYYPAYRYALPESDLRFKVKQREASVYVDGYFAGVVDDFDGTFGRLHLPPGQHEIVVYLEGHHSLRRQLYLSINKTRTIEGELEPLPAGAPNEPLPTPIEGRNEEDESNPPPRPDPRRTPPSTRAPEGDPRDQQPQPRQLPPGNSTSVSLSIRVQPGGSTVLIDNESWKGPSDASDRLLVQVEPGHHTIEVQRDGYERFVTEIDAKPGETVPVNVTLTRAR